MNEIVPICCVCYNEFDLKRHEAVILTPCGHSFCRTCSVKLPNRQCGKCRIVFSSIVTNWAINDLVRERQAAAPRTPVPVDVAKERAKLLDDLQDALSATRLNQQNLERQTVGVRAALDVFAQDVSKNVEQAVTQLMKRKADMLERLQAVQEQNQSRIEAAQVEHKELLSTLQSMLDTLTATPPPVPIPTNAAAASASSSSDAIALLEHPLIQLGVLCAVRNELNRVTNNVSPVQLHTLSMQVKPQSLQEPFLVAVAPFRELTTTSTLPARNNSQQASRVVPEVVNAAAEDAKDVSSLLPVLGSAFSSQAWYQMPEQQGNWSTFTQPNVSNGLYSSAFQGSS